jgi:adenylyl cyclase-associated protein
LVIINDLYNYVKEYHRTGLVWNQNGENPETAFSKISSQSTGSKAPTPTATAPQPAPAQSAGGPPPPPPPPPVMTDFEDTPAKPAPAPTGASAVFAELNKGASVTSGLRKVDKSQMTHKNPSLRAGSTVSEDAVKKPRPPTPNKPGKYVLKKPAKTELQGNKWVVENHDSNSNVVIEGEINHAVYIYGCKNSTIRIKGKVNAVTMGKFGSICDKR